MPCGVSHDTISGFTSLVLAHNPPAFKAAGSGTLQSLKVNCNMPGRACMGKTWV